MIVAFYDLLINQFLSGYFNGSIHTPTLTLTLIFKMLF